MTIYFCFLVQRNKREILGILGDVAEGTRDGIKIMSTNGSIFSCSAKSVMQFLLSSNECFVCLIIEGDVTQDSSSDEWTDLFDLYVSKITDGSMVMEVVGAVSTTYGNSVFPRYSLKALTRLASDSKSGRLFMQSNLKYSLTTFPSLSFSSSSSISIPNSKPRLSSH